MQPSKDSTQSGMDDPSSYMSIPNGEDSILAPASLSQSSINQNLEELASPDDSTRLFYITELVQNIFANLPFRDLVVCTGVCKTWRQLIRHESPTAYQIFMKPILKAPFIPITFPDKRNLPDWKLEKLRGEWHRSLNTSSWCTKERCARLRLHRTVGKRFIHPLFYELALNEETCLRINGHSASFVFLTPDAISLFLKLHEHSAPDASWCKMLLTNPTVEWFAAYSELLGDVVENDNGVKLGEVATYISEMMRREESRKEDWADESRSKMVERMLAEERTQRGE
jgi:hypothetical protein